MAYKSDVRGESFENQFTVTVQGMRGAIKGRRWTISSDGPSPWKVQEAL